MPRPFTPNYPGHEPDPKFYDRDGSNLLDMDPGRDDDDLPPCYGFKIQTREVAKNPAPWRWQAFCGGCRTRAEAYTEHAAVQKIRDHQEGDG